MKSLRDILDLGPDQVIVNNQFYCFYDNTIETGLIHFEDIITTEMFSIPENTEFLTQNPNAVFTFKVDGLDEPTSIQFLKTSPLVP